MANEKSALVPVEICGTVHGNEYRISRFLHQLLSTFQLIKTGRLKDEWHHYRSAIYLSPDQIGETVFCIRLSNSFEHAARGVHGDSDRRLKNERRQYRLPVDLWLLYLGLSLAAV